MALPERYVEKEFYTEAEYLSWEEDALTKSEYVDGEIRAMSGGTDDHNTICQNMGASLWNALRGRGCRVMNSDMKVWAGGAFYYPDVTVVCGPRRYRGRGTSGITNPLLVAEVSSKNTEAKDRGEKFIRYQNIGTLNHYLLVSQSEARVELYLRSESGHWNYTLVAGLDSSLAIPALGIILAPADLYNEIAFTQGADNE